MGQENKIIAFANMKGGVGKSSVCIALADWLTMAGVPTVVVDADLQQSIASLRDREKDSYKGQEAPWQIMKLNTTYFDDKGKKQVEENIRQTLDKIRKIPATFLIDCPGNASDDPVKYIYNAADVIVIPMDFTAITVDSTEKFASLLQRMKDAGLVSAKIYFLPNKYDERRKQVLRDEVKGRLKKFGYLGTRINNRSDIERISTYSFPSRIRGFFKYAFEALIQFVYGKAVNI